MSNKFFTYVTLFIVGAAAGASYALLNTPQSGKKTRAQLQKEMKGVRSRTRKAINKAQSSAMDRLDEIQDLIQEISDEAVHQTERLKAVSQQVADMPKTILERKK